MKIFNKKISYTYDILDEYTAGIMLLGSEVKSIRRGDVNILDSYAYIKNGEVWVKNLKVSKYKNSFILDDHDVNREKKLLLNKHEINKIQKNVMNNGITIVILGIIEVNNKIKVKIGIARGKKLYEKRESIKKKEFKKELYSYS